MNLRQLTNIAATVRQARYPEATTVLLAGSSSRDEGTATSDLDLIVLFEHVECAYRESFTFQEFPVEAFVHDPNTLRYFFVKVDSPSGVPSLMSMVCEGVVVVDNNNLADSVKKLANQLLLQGPGQWGQPESDASRYAITNLVDDLRAPRSRAEALATGSALYAGLAEFYFRMRSCWLATDKQIPREMRKIDPRLADRYEHAFEALMRDAQVQPVIDLAEQILEQQGGFLFDGYQRFAPAQWRLP